MPGKQMTIVLELTRPWLWRPGYFKSRIMYRAWWGWWAVGILRIGFKEFSEESFEWKK
jgi:hypothetical protein